MTLVPMLNLDRRPDNDDARPANVEAEQALLGIILFDNTAYGGVSYLQSVTFIEPMHQRIWSLCAELIAKGERAEPIILKNRLAGHPAFEEMGGLRYLADLVDHAPPSSSAQSYAKAVQDVALRRELIAFAGTISNGAAEADDPYEVLSHAEIVIGQLAAGAAPDESCLMDARSSAETRMAEIEEEAEHGRPKGHMTGLRCIDRRLRGLKPGHLVIIAGRPGMGKTALARSVCMGAAERNPHHLFAFFALEMERAELDDRTISELSHRQGEGIAYQDMTGDKLTPMERARIREDILWRIPRNFIIDDSASLTVDYVKRRVWALKRRGPVGAVFIDYLQIMDRPAADRRNDAAVIGEMTKNLKNLARSAGVCVVLLSQINRGVESRDDKRPQLSDLRESGAIEQDANAVLFPFREGYYLERAEPKDGTPQHSQWEQDVENLRRRMDVICAKNRGGAPGSDHQDYFAEFDHIQDVRA
jgi:replicative DNA helicase